MSGRRDVTFGKNDRIVNIPTINVTTDASLTKAGPSINQVAPETHTERSKSYPSHNAHTSKDSVSSHCPSTASSLPIAESLPSRNFKNVKNTHCLTPQEINRRNSIKLLKYQLQTHERGIRRTTVQLFRSWMAPSETPVNLKLFGGARAVQEEQERSRDAGWIIHPYSSLRYHWDLVIMILLAINMVILPLNIAFFYDNSLPTWIVFHSMSDVLFLTDIVLNFRTGYKEDKNGYRMKFILDPKLIARRYMRTWLMLDVISSFPIDNIILLINGGTSDFGLGLKSASRAFKFLRLAKLLSLLKLLRLSRIFRYVSRYEEFYHITASVMRYIKLVLMMLLVAHWNGCMGFLIPMLQDFPHNSWVSLNDLTEAHWSEQYGWALFKALSHMLCIGYGRFIPQLLSEAWFTIFSMITGATFYALFIAHSMAYIHESDSARRQYQEKFKQIEEYMCYRNLPIRTREKISDYYEHKYSQKRLFNEEEILSEVSPPLRDEIINYNCRDLIESVPFLREGGTDFITLIISKLTFDVYLPCDLIIKEGSFGQHMYFIRHGVVDIIAEDQFVSTLTEGDYFGEITMLTNARRVATVRAATMCDLFILSKENLYTALEEFPEMRVIMEHVALDRLMKLKKKFPGRTTTAEAQSNLEKRQLDIHVSEVPTTISVASNMSSQNCYTDDYSSQLTDGNSNCKTESLDKTTTKKKEGKKKNFITNFKERDIPRRHSLDYPRLPEVTHRMRSFSAGAQSPNVSHGSEGSVPDDCNCDFCMKNAAEKDHIVI